MSTRSYLEQSVVSVVMQGMTEVAKVRPDNPLEFLGNYILNASKNKDILEPDQEEEDGDDAEEEDDEGN